MKNKRTWIVLVALVVVAGAIGFAAWTGLYPPREGTEGAIGAASRYQTPQMSASDVSLGDARIQAFLQTEFFNKLVTDPRFRALVNSTNFETLARQRHVLKNVVELFGGGGRGILRNEEVVELLKSRRLRNTEVAEAFKAIIAKKPRLLATEPILEALKDPKVLKLMENVEALRGPRAGVLKDIDGYQELADSYNAEVLAIVTSEEVVAARDHVDEIVEALKGVKKLLDNQEFLEGLRNEVLFDTLVSEEMAALTADGTVEALLNDNAAMEVFSDPSYSDVWRNPEILDLGQQELLDDAVAEAAKRDVVR